MVNETGSRDAISHGRHLVHRSRQIWLQIIIAAIIFASGIVVGWGGTMIFLKGRITRMFRHPPAQAAAFIVEQLQAEYDLTEEQSRQVKEIFKKSLQNMQTIREEMMQKSMAERAEVVAQMKKVLSAEQFERWEQEFKAREKRFRRMRPPGGWRGPGQPGPGRRGPGPPGPNRPGPRRFGPERRGLIGPGLQDPNSAPE